MDGGAHLGREKEVGGREGGEKEGVINEGRRRVREESPTITCLGSIDLMAALTHTHTVTSVSWTSALTTVMTSLA